MVTATAAPVCYESESLSKISLSLKLNCVPTSEEKPVLAAAAPPRVKLALTSVARSALVVAGSMRSGLRREVLLTVARPTSRPAKAPRVAGTPAEAVPPKRAPPPTPALICRLAAEATPALAPNEIPPEALAERPAPPPMDKPAPPPIDSPALAEAVN